MWAETARVLPRDARDLLIKAAATPLPNPESPARIVAVNKAVEVIKSKYPHLFKEQHHG